MCGPEYLTVFLAIYLLCVKDGVTGRPDGATGGLDGVIGRSNGVSERPSSAIIGPDGVTEGPDDVNGVQKDIKISDVSSNDDIDLNGTDASKDDDDAYEDTLGEWPDVTASARQMEEDLSVNKRGRSERADHTAGHSTTTTNQGDHDMTSVPSLTNSHIPRHALTNDRDTNILLTPAPIFDNLLTSPANIWEQDETEVNLEVPSERSLQPIVDHVTVLDQSGHIVDNKVNISTESTTDPINRLGEHNEMVQMTIYHGVDDTTTVSSISHAMDYTTMVNSISHVVDDTTMDNSHVLSSQSSEETNSTQTLDSIHGMDTVREDDHNNELSTTPSSHSNVNIAQEVGHDRPMLDHNASDMDGHNTPVTRKDISIMDHNDSTHPVETDSNFHANVNPTLSYDGQPTNPAIRQSTSPAIRQSTTSTNIAADVPQVQQTQVTQRMNIIYTTRDDTLTQTSEPGNIASSTDLTSTSQFLEDVTLRQSVTDDAINTTDLPTTDLPTTDLSATDLPTTDLPATGLSATDLPAHEQDDLHKDDKNDSDLHPDVISAISTSAHHRLSPTPSNSQATQTRPSDTTLSTLSSAVPVTTPQADTPLTTRSSSNTRQSTEDKYSDRTTSTTHWRRPSPSPTLTELIRSTLSLDSTPPSVRGRDVIIVRSSPHPTSRSNPPSNPTPTTGDVTTLPDQGSEVTLQPENIFPGRNLTGNLHSFMELDLAMSWKRFCTDEDPIKGELVEILGRRHTIISIDQIKVLNNEGQCSEQTQEIQVHMYLMDKHYHYDKTLTQTCYIVLKESSSMAEESIIRTTLKNVRIREPPMEQVTSLTTSSSVNEPPAIVKDPSLLSDPGVTIALVLSLVGGCCCAGLITLQVIFRRRNRERHNFNPTFNRSQSASSLDSIQLSSVTKSRPNSGLFNPGLDLTDCLQPSHPLNFMQLSNFCANEKHISEEFQKLPSRMPRLSVVPTGEEDKNRYANILPLAQTRVKLLQDGPEPRPSYINANYMTGPNNQCQYYIATQAPTQTTIHDFWTMVWQQNSRAIVMLTQMEEDGQSKCANYWPELVGKSAAQKFGDFLIELKQKDVQQEYISSKLEIHHLRKIEKREIYHFWYTCWPAHGQPEPISLVKLVLDTRPKYENSGTPLIVHCSPGTGRTGTFIALDLCMRQFEVHRIVDVFKTVYLMRQERAGVIQNKEQYSLLYNAINEYATIVVSPVVSAASSATTLHALLSS